MELIKALNWRYATKRMIDQKVSEDELQQVLESIRLAPTSYGLQPFAVTVIENKDLLNEIYEKACPQVVINQCSHLLVFRARKKIDADLVDDYTEEMVRARNSTPEDVSKFREKIQWVIDNPAINKFSWTIRQTYIAFGYATFAAAKLGIDATPIEGFNPVALNELMGINLDQEEAVVLLALGYRNEKEDRLANQPKIRRSREKLFQRIK